MLPWLGCPKQYTTLLWEGWGVSSLAGSHTQLLPGLVSLVYIARSLAAPACRAAAAPQAQLNGRELGWAPLNRLCWAIGSISGSMVEEQENRWELRGHCRWWGTAAGVPRSNGPGPAA
jgi:hypothetical protein